MPARWSAADAKLDRCVYPSALVWDERLTGYRFSPDHPLNPRRLQLTLELIRALDLLDGSERRVEPARTASDAEILTVHSRDYVDAVRRAAPSAPHGLGTLDVPVVSGMHEAAAHVAGATLRAAELIASGTVLRAFSIAGGLHHAHRSQASGFCVYNDIAVAVRWLQRAHSMRVLYVDIDAHHGDGVQSIFYDDPDVLTLSFHESGAFLFPGTGFIDEAGAGDGYGMSVNVPLDPHTGDASFMEAVTALVPAFADAFRPDIVVLQAGCDAHVLDPLTHLRCTTALYADAVNVMSDVARKHCGGRMLVTGGGGYAVHQVVPRAWTLVWATLCGVDAPDDLPPAWVDALEAECGMTLPRTLRDAPDAFDTTSHETSAAANRRTVGEVRRRSLPLVTGWGLGF